jgi:acetate kinase
MSAALGGLDAIAFSGGVREESALVRARVCGSSALPSNERDQPFGWRS